MSDFGNNESQVTKQMSQAALRIKALAQLRQVLRASPGRAGIAYSVGKDLMILLRYLPAGLMNKIQNFKSSSSSSASASSSSSSGDQSDSNSVPQPPPSSVPPSPTNKGNKGKDEDSDSTYEKISNRFKLISVSLPSSPMKSIPETTVTSIDDPLGKSVLENVLTMSTKNNAVIVNKEDIETKVNDMQSSKQREKDEQLAKDFATVIAETAAAAEASKDGSKNDSGKPVIEPRFSRELLEAGRRVREIQLPRFVDFSENYKEIGNRTKILVSCVEKSLVSANGSKHNLIHHLDDLFSHIYQYSDSKQVAIDTGAIKIVNAIIKKYPDDSRLVGRGREVLALLGCNPPTKGQGIKILSIDGGGVRGLVAVEVLRALEKLTKKPIYELFDYICGVSTGSIIAFLLGAHRQPLDVAEALYKDLSRQIFSQNSFWGSATLVWSHAYYHTPTFEKILKKHCGEIPLISQARDPTLPRISAISTIVNHERAMPYVFRTYTFPPTVEAKYTGGCRYHMWESVRASAAAPTYFEEFKLGNYLHQDGGIIVNNPTAVAIGEARNLWGDTPIQCVVSLGNGITVTSSADKNLGEFMEEGAHGETYLSWKGKFLKVLDSATDTETVHNTLNELLPSDVYYRFNPYLSKVVSLDETNPDLLEQMQIETREYLARNVDRLQNVSQTLVKQKGLTKRVADWWNQF